MQICEHTGLAVEGCGHCRGLSDRVEDKALPFEARFIGRCQGCSGRIEPGDMVVALGDFGYRHEEC